jgi:sulfate permease, SulP family
MNPMNIFEEVNNLNFPIGEYIILGSGILEVLGIREVADIDILVSDKLFNELRGKGWPYGQVEIEGRMREKLSKGIIEIFKDFWYGGQTQDAEKMMQEAQIINSIPFLSLQELMKIKRVLARPKDMADIALIEDYLKNHDL